MGICLPNVMDITPVKFHPYTSVVQSRIAMIEYHTGSTIDKFCQKLLDHFNSCGIKCSSNNKIVFECKLFEQTVCFGFYDWSFIIGLHYYDENEDH